jgi:hypothetical protein
MPSLDEVAASGPPMTRMTQISRTVLACAMAVVVSAPAFAQTARQRYETATARDEKVRVLLTGNAAAPGASREGNRVVRGPGPPLPHQRICR